MSLIKIGSIIGNWKVLSETYNSGKIRVNDCECICGTMKQVQTWHLTHSKTMSCGCTNVKGRFKFEGVGSLSKSYYNQFKSSRKRKGFFFSNDITIEFLWELYNKQNGKCALSGIDIVLNPRWSRQNNGKSDENFQTASIDRKDNSIG